MTMAQDVLSLETPHEGPRSRSRSTVSGSTNSPPPILVPPAEIKSDEPPEDADSTEIPL
jgi:hypothetical protein